VVQQFLGNDDVDPDPRVSGAIARNSVAIPDRRLVADRLNARVKPKPRAKAPT